MARLNLPKDLVARMQATLPDGYDASEMRVLRVAAQLQPVGQADDADAVVLASMHEGGPPMVTEGRPTIMRVVAWMAHEGVNSNRDAFVAQELAALAPTLFRAPNFGVMDWNHSAVLPSFFVEDSTPKVIGVWYKAEYAFDQTAGKWGLLATGMLFAWTFPEQATALLGEQAREGHASFSMACLPGGVEYREDDKGEYAVLHNPVFFTVSALDVTPADPAAVGLVTEAGEDGSEEDLARDLTAATTTDFRVTNVWIPTVTTSSGTWIGSGSSGAWQNTTQLEVAMEESEKKVLEDARDAALGKVTELDATVAVLETRVAELEGSLAGHGTPLAEAERAELTTRITELETALEAAKTARETADARLVELEQAAAEVAKVQAEADVKAAEDAKEAVLVQRMSVLGKDFLKAFAKRSEADQSRLKVRWAAMSAEEWTDFTDSLGLMPTRVGFRFRSEEEGLLSVGGGVGDNSVAARVARIRKQ